MKNSRRLAAFVASILAVACMAAPMATVSAAEEKGSITITDSSGATSSNVKAYQVFTASVQGDTVTITGWGDGITIATLSSKITADSTLSTAFSGITIENTPASAQAVAAKLSDLNKDATANKATIEAFARAAAQSVTGEGHAATDGTISNLDFGYYVAVDSEAAQKNNYESYSLGMLQVVSSTNAAEITVKRDFPSFDKQIGDINDSTASDNTYSFNEAADHDIGDTVPFKLIATVPSNIDRYDTYKMIFHDDLQENVFSFNSDSVVVKYYSSADDNEADVVTSSFTVATPNAADDKFPSDSHTDGTKDFTVTCNDITNIPDVTVASGGRFEVEYNATLTTDAVLGEKGNWNGAYLEYSNNPNLSGSGDTGNTGKSPVDYVVAFTYQTVVDKVNGTTQEALAGAGFTLYKVGSDFDIDTSMAADSSTGVWAFNDGVNAKQTYTAVGQNKVSNEATSFEFKGLDDGTYVLVESTIPEGYSGIKPIKFTVSETETQTDGSEAMTALSLTGDGVSAKKLYVANVSDGSFAEDTENNTVNAAAYAKVGNNRGSSLPTTGGIGTKIFYAAGGVLVVGAGVLLVSKKRMANK